MAKPMTHAADEVLVEAESFADKGGWEVDQQFTHIMGSPYLLAHGMGSPVANARTTVPFPKKGTYHLWVRTKDWAPGSWDAPGRFQVIVGSRTLDPVFGTQGGWAWQDGGAVEITDSSVSIELSDLTGFDGRCDALYFSTDPNNTPPNDPDSIRPWRSRLLGEPETPVSAGTFDVVIAGGGIAGCAAALAAERQGLKVALIHDRPVLGGNASSEVRVGTEGIHGRGKRIIEGLDTKHRRNGSPEAISDTIKRHATMDAARDVHQFLSWRVYAANTEGAKVVSVDARNIESGEIRRFSGTVFIDCTGDGWIGYWAGADCRYGRESADTYGEEWAEHGDRWSPKTGDNLIMGTSLLWNSERRRTPVSFPEVPWAMAVANGREATEGKWYWEYASDDKHQVDDAEEIRDHLLRAIYGSFYNAKQDVQNADVALKWVGYIAGKRESRRLIGDYIYTQDDAVSKRSFRDTVAEEERAIDIHYQHGEQDFLARAIFRSLGGLYYVPFRCLYSRSIDNLMMAGRCFSCSHIGLGGPRVMRTIGQMGIATGFAASLCKKHNTTPRGVYERHIDELRMLIGYGGHTD